MEKLLRRMDEMSSDERKQLRTLLKEKNKDETQMGWMYRADKPDDEEYLLGRRIDKLEEEPKEEEDTGAPGASFQEVLAKRADLDMQAKMREDPLYAIRKREEDARRRLLENPIKMKQLQKELKKRKKKEKKRKKSEGVDSDDELMAKYMAILKKKGGGDLSDARKRLEGDGSPESHDRSHDKSHDRPKHHRKRSHEERDSEQSHRREDGDSRDSRRHHGNREDWRHDSRDAYGSSRDKSKMDRNDREDRNMREERRADNQRRDSRRDDRDRSSRSDRERYSDNNRQRQHHKMDDKNGRSETSHRSDKSRTRHDSSDSDSDTPRGKDISRNVHQKQRRSRSSSSDSSSGDQQSHQGGGQNRSGPKPAQKRGRHDSSSSSSSESGTSDSDADSDESPRKPPPKQFGLIIKGDAKPRTAPQPVKVESYKKEKVEPRKKSPPRKKLTAAELEKRRQEMMDNASWRNEQRQKNVKRYNEEDEAEKAVLEKQKHNNSADFINPLMAKHASQSSVEDRIKRNRYNVQRSKGDRDGGFTKR